MKKILTLILDGFGESEIETGNALKSASMPNYRSLLDTYPHSLLFASGPKVGLPNGQTGSENVGYTTIGAGKIIKQRSSFVHDFVDVDSLSTNQDLKAAIEYVRKKKSRIHVMGLMSDGGECSNIKDIIKIIKFLKNQDVKVGIDFIADGKDVEAKSALKYIEELEETEVPIISVCGRYYAMDEEEKWDRTRIYYDLVRNGIGLKVKELKLALKNCYIRNITDEFLPPIIVEPDCNLKDNDVIMWVNHSETGSTQILTSISNPNEITEFQTRPLKNAQIMTLYPVSEKVKSTVLIDEEDISDSSFGEHLSKLELSQARIASAYSYEYITYYFNGENEKKLHKCNNYLIDLPETIKGQKLKLDTAGVTKQIIKCMEKDTDIIFASLSSAAEVAKTGDFESTVDMLEFIDECIGKIKEGAELNFYKIVIVSPYGNLENMIDEENKAITVNTTNKVPFLIADAKVSLRDGSLTDVAPTILSYMDISVPESMKDSDILIRE